MTYSRPASAAEPAWIPVEVAEIRDAIYSREELHDLPVDLHTQFFKPDPADAKLTVLFNRHGMKKLMEKFANLQKI